VKKEGGKAQPEVKDELHQRKIMLCVWWNVEGVVHWKLLPRSQTLNADIYCAQLRRVNDAVGRKYLDRQHPVIL